MFRCKSRAISFVDQSNLDNLQNLIETYRLYDHAFARNDLDHSLDHQAIEGLMDRRAADFQD